MIKILYITYDGISDPLGMSQVLSYLKLLPKKNFKIFVFSFEKKKKIQRYFDIINQNEVSHIEFEFINFRNGSFMKIFSFIIAYIKLFKIIRAKQIDIIHCRGYFSALIGGLINLIFNKKFLYDYRSFPLLEWREIGKIQNKLLINFLSNLDNFIIKKSDHINILVKYAKEYFQKKKFHATFSVIPTCSSINKSFYLPKMKNIKEKISLVYVGGVKNPYNLSDIFKLFQILFKFNSNTFLTIINDDDHHLIKSNNIFVNNTKNIKVKRIHNESLSEELFKHDFGLLFLDITESRKMSCPTKIGEYLSCGLGLISNQGIKIVDHDLYSYENVNIIKNLDELNVESFYRKLILLKNNKNFKLDSINIAKKHFNLFTGVNEYSKIYLKLMNYKSA